MHKNEGVKTKKPRSQNQSARRGVDEKNLRDDSRELVNRICRVFIWRINFGMVGIFTVIAIIVVMNESCGERGRSNNGETG